MKSGLPKGVGKIEVQQATRGDGISTNKKKEVKEGLLSGTLGLSSPIYLRNKRGTRRHCCLKKDPSGCKNNKPHFPLGGRGKKKKRS